MASQQAKPRVVHAWPKYPTKGDTLRRIVDNGETGYERRLVLERRTGVDAMGVEQWAEVVSVSPRERARGGDDDEERLSQVLLLEIAEAKREAEVREDGFAARTKKIEEELANARREVDRLQRLLDGPADGVTREAS